LFYPHCRIAVTLLSSEPEVQYVALRNILVILQKYPDLLKNDIKVFFCKYYDPVYVKLSKLEIMIRLTNESNVDQVLPELKELRIATATIHVSANLSAKCALYSIVNALLFPFCFTIICVIRYAAEVDVDFVRKSVRAIGRCAITIEKAAERCIEALVELIQTKVNYVVQEAIVVIKVSLLDSQLFSLSFLISTSLPH
jgi:vesicle coat complex subunit